MSHTLWRTGALLGAVAVTLTVATACGPAATRPAARGGDRLPDTTDPGPRDDAASDPTTSTDPRPTAGDATTDRTGATAPRDLGPAGLAPERAATALLATVGPDGALPSTAVVPGIELDPALLRRLAPATATGAPSTIRDDGVRADVRIEVADLAVVVTLLRWEGRWRVGDLLALRDEPPLIVLDAGAGA